MNFNQQLRFDAASRWYESRDIDLEGHAVCVSGSTARGWCELDSDVDLIAIRQSGGTSSQKEDLEVLFEGSQLNLVTYSWDWLESYFTVQSDLAQLRLASSFSVALPICDCKSMLTMLRQVNRQLVLSPSLSSYYLDIARACTQASGKQVGFRQRLMVSKALQVAILLKLAHSPFRVIKQKWTWRCLETLAPSFASEVAVLLQLERVGVGTNWEQLSQCLKSMSEENLIASASYRRLRKAISWGQQQEMHEAFSRNAACYLKERVLMNILDGCFELKAPPSCVNEVIDFVEVKLGSVQTPEWLNDSRLLGTVVESQSESN